MSWDEDGTFVKAIAAVILHEGGYVNDPDDPGGETKYGISRRSYPDVDIKSLTQEQAAAIYYRDFWDGRYDKLRADLGSKLLDIAVPSGNRTAVRCLQRALRSCGYPLDDDGVMGPKTKAAADEAKLDCLLAALRSEFAGYCRLIGVAHAAMQKFETGWLARAYS